MSTHGGRDKRAPWGLFQETTKPTHGGSPDTRSASPQRPRLLRLSHWALEFNTGIVVTHRYSVQSNLHFQKYSRQKLSIALIYVHYSYLKSYSSIFDWRWMNCYSVPLLSGTEGSVWSDCCLNLSAALDWVMPHINPLGRQRSGRGGILGMHLSFTALFLSSQWGNDTFGNWWRWAYRILRFVVFSPPKLGCSLEHAHFIA